MKNSEDPDEIPHNAAFHQGLHYLLRLKQSLGTEIHQNLETPIIYNKQSHPYCFDLDGKISEYKGLIYRNQKLTHSPLEYLKRCLYDFQSNLIKLMELFISTLLLIK